MISINELEISINELEISINELEISINELDISINAVSASIFIDINNSLIDICSLEVFSKEQITQIYNSTFKSVKIINNTNYTYIH